MRILVAVDGARGVVLADDLRREGVAVSGAVAASALSDLAHDRLLGVEAAEVSAVLADAEAVALHVGRAALTAATVALCDRAGVRIIPLCETESEERLSAAFGLGPVLPVEADGDAVVRAVRSDPRPGLRRDERTGSSARVIAVWGPAGAPGRSTVAVGLATELARGRRHVALVDADTHAPSMALSLGLPDEGPGFAAACRQAEIGGLDARELARISVPLEGGSIDVLTGINRPSRWPELSAPRVSAALAACRDWADHTVVDVGASLETDEEIVSDIDGPRRNAATLAALRSADVVVAVAAADPVGISRFLRGHAELRTSVGATRIVTVVNRLRPGPLGLDPRGQVRGALDRFGGVGEVWFLPHDAKATDAAALAARPVAAVAPRSALTQAVRRLVGEAIVPPTVGETAGAASRRHRHRRRRRAS